MKPFAIAIIAGLATVLSFAAVLQPVPSPAQTVPTAPSQELPKTYVPGLGEFMGRIQVDHAKLWLAGEARNWELAEYQLTEQGGVLGCAGLDPALPKRSGRRHD
jgi:hypothetical protein